MALTIGGCNMIINVTYDDNIDNDLSCVLNVSQIKHFDTCFKYLINKCYDTFIKNDCKNDCKIELNICDYKLHIKIDESIDNNKIDMFYCNEIIKIYLNINNDNEYMLMINNNVFKFNDDNITFNICQPQP